MPVVSLRCSAEAAVLVTSPRCVVTLHGSLPWRQDPQHSLMRPSNYSCLRFLMNTSLALAGQKYISTYGRMLTLPNQHWCCGSLRSWSIRMAVFLLASLFSLFHMWDVDGLVRLPSHTSGGWTMQYNSSFRLKPRSQEYLEAWPIDVVHSVCLSSDPLWLVKGGHCSVHHMRLFWRVNF